MRVTITDEQTRWILQTTAWNMARRALEGGVTDEENDGLFYLDEQSYRQGRRQAEQRIAEFREMSQLADKFERSAIGDEVKVPEALWEELRAVRDSAVEAVDEPGRWIPNCEERLRWLYPAAVRLDAALRVPGTVA